MDMIIVVVAVALVTAGIAAAARRATVPRTDEGGYLLQYGAVMRLCAVGLPVLILFGMGLLLLQHPVTSREDVVAVVSLLIFFGFLLGYGVIEGLTVKVWVGPSGIRGTSGWRGYRKYTWAEISRIRYSPLSGWFKVEAPGKAPLRVHGWISGILEFQQMFMRHLPEDRWREAHARALEDRRIPVPGRD